MSTHSVHEQGAYDMGRDAALAAASWIIDGNTKRELIPAVLEMFDNGDPRVDEYLPARPNLSGEWADDLTPAKLYEQVTGESYWPSFAFNEDHDDLVDALADAYEAGVSDHFEAECERLLRAAVDPSLSTPER